MGLMKRAWMACLGCGLAMGMASFAWNAIGQAQPKRHVEVPDALRLDINHASVEELLKVPGMTKTWAARIVRFRPYRSKNELLDKGVVSAEVYGRIKDYIVAHREKTKD